MEKIDHSKMTEEEFLAQYDPTQFPKGPYLAVDNVLFAVEELPNDNIRKLSEKRLQVLLVKRTEHPFLGLWSLPGIFPGWEETLEEACLRSLRLKSHLQDIHLEQLYTFSNPRRDPRTRIVSTSYMGLVNKSMLPHIEASPTAEWFTIGSSDFPKKLAFDHAMIIEYGLQRIRNKLEYTDIAFSLLPKEFTLAQLQQVYEIILGKSLSKANFQRKIKDKVESTNTYQTGGFRPALLYKHKKPA
ncbi:MAG: NUDIX hydrolase [Firmicutes bacterium]|nr:NUDIX hydrolase [Bacillota bacterium]